MPLEVIQWGSGNVGRMAIRSVVASGPELVGPLVHGAAKAGRHTGEIAGIGRPGVAATTDVGAAAPRLRSALDLPFITGRFTFSDHCEVDRMLLAFLGGFEDACEPRHLPWRHAQDRVNHLALNFFHAMLNNDPAAVDRLESAVVNARDDIVLETK
jgi:hypothetical protein